MDKCFVCCGMVDGGRGAVGVAGRVGIKKMRKIATYFNLKYKMLFHTLRRRLIGELQASIRSGEFTERSLARYLGVSQPHLHNVLHGVRALTFDLADHAIVKLQIPWQTLWKDGPPRP